MIPISGVIQLFLLTHDSSASHLGCVLLTTFGFITNALTAGRDPEQYPEIDGRNHG